MRTLMNQESPHANPYHRCAVVRGRPSAVEEETASDAGKGKRVEDEDLLLLLSKPTGWVVSAITAQAELISTPVLFICSPFFSLFFHAGAVPARVAHNTATAFRGLIFGLLSAAYAITSLIVIMALAFLLGVFLVRLWVEEPILLSRPLHFDYTQRQPVAVAMLGRVGTRGREVPAGHMVSVALKLVMPESDFNRNVGIFQVSTQVISSNGHMIATSSRPCMLRFNSLPIRLMRIFATAIPLLIGVHTETEQIVFETLRYNEGTQKTKSINVTLTARAGTYDLPQIYDAEILLRTQLPLWKQVLHNWKWTLYVWVSLNIYALLLMVLVCRFNLFVLSRHRNDNPVQLTKTDRDRRLAFAGDVMNFEEFSDAFRRWRERSGSKIMASNQAAHNSSEVIEVSDSIEAGETRVLDDSASFVGS